MQRSLQFALDEMLAVAEVFVKGTKIKLPDVKNMVDPRSASIIAKAIHECVEFGISAGRKPDVHFRIER